MTTTKNFRIVLSLMLLSIILGITLTYATTEDNYKNDNNFLTNISESTLTENGYKTNIIINLHTTGIYAKENGYKIDLTINPEGIGGSHRENNYQLDLIPEKTFLAIPDVAIAKIVTSKTVVGQGYSLLINVTVSNQALNYETFHVIIHANTTTIKTQTVTLTNGNSTTLTFTWNTTGFAKGNYTISAVADTVPGETYTADNTLIDGVVRVTIPGDINGDGWVDGMDLTPMGMAWGSTVGQPNYNPNADLNCDGEIDGSDLTIMGFNWGQYDP